MLQQLKMLGDYMEERGEGGLKTYFESEKLSSYDYILSVDFKESEEGYIFDGVSEYDMKGNENKVMYKFGTPVGGDQTPTSRVGGGTEKLEKTIDRVFDSWFMKQEDAENVLITSVREEWRDKRKEVSESIKEKFENLDGDTVLTVRFEDEGEFKFIKEFDVFKNILREEVAKRWYYQSSKGKSIADEERCSICHEKKEVYGYAFPYNFYTVDNKRYAPDFNRSDSWKNIPMCEDCAFKIRIGQKFIDQQNFGYYIGEGLKYYVMPEFLRGTDYDFLDAVMDYEDTEEGLLEAEEFYKKPEDTVNLDFLFYKVENQSETIQKHVQDVAPSYLNSLDKSLGDVFSRFYGINGYSDNEPEDLKQLDTLIYRVLPRPNRDGAGNKAFFNKAMDMTAKILKGKEVEEKGLVRSFSEEELSRFRNNDFYQQYAIRTFFFLEFLRENDLLDSKGKNTMKSYEQIVEDLDTGENENLKEFFSDHSEAFDTPEKKAVFLEGVLAQNLMDKQRMMRETDEPPFRKKLANLRLNSNKVKQLFPEISQTLDIYNSKAEPQYRNSYSDLRETIGHYLLLSDQNNWSISDDEISYFFTLGMSLNQVFKNNNNGEQ
jgi:CRISPR-associated protein Csh1